MRKIRVYTALTEQRRLRIGVGQKGRHSVQAVARQDRRQADTLQRRVIVWPNRLYNSIQTSVSSPKRPG